MRVEVDEAPRGLVIFDCRPPWPDTSGAEWMRMPIAKLMYSGRRNEWTLYWTDRNDRFHLHEDCRPSADVGALLAEIDADPTCIFWG